MCVDEWICRVNVELNFTIDTCILLLNKYVSDEWSSTSHFFIMNSLGKEMIEVMDQFLLQYISSLIQRVKDIIIYQKQSVKYASPS